jgi:uncharacterized protein (UPF0264 family)
MTGMLASVNSIAEAKVVHEAGVDILDIKNPHEGALGALDVNAVKDIVQSVNGEVLTSATIGDVKSDHPQLLNFILSMSETGVDYVKVGLFDKHVSESFIKTLTEATSKGIKLVVVLFAENYNGVDSIINLMQSGISGVMLDTKEKKSKNLCANLKRNELKKFIETAKKYKLLTGLAGSLKYENISSLLELNPDYLGFRGALCSESNRVNTVNKKQVNDIRSAIPLTDFNEFEDKQYKEAII